MNLQNCNFNKISAPSYPDNIVSGGYWWLPSLLLTHFYWDSTVCLRLNFVTKSWTLLHRDGFFIDAGLSIDTFRNLSDSTTLKQDTCRWTWKKPLWSPRRTICAQRVLSRNPVFLYSSAKKKEIEILPLLILRWKVFSLQVCSFC